MTFGGYSKGVSSRVSRKFMKLSRKGKFQDASRVFQYFQVSFQYVLMFPVCFKSDYQYVLKVFQVCSKKLSGRFKKVSCCMVLIAASRAEGGLVFFNFKIEGLFFDCIFFGLLVILSHI